MRILSLYVVEESPKVRDQVLGTLGPGPLDSLLNLMQCLFQSFTFTDISVSVLVVIASHVDVYGAHFLTPFCRPTW